MLAILGAAVGVGVFSWWVAPQATPRGHGFNVLLISLDTTRADHLGCYGFADIKTPNIDRLAAEGTLFSQCTSSCPLTLPSHSSMMTGTYPFVHGVRTNGEFYLHPNNMTLAEALSKNGYTTAAEVAAFVLNREFGLDQGFGVYNDVPADTNTIAKITRSAEDVCSGAIEFMERNVDQEFFLFVHFYDPHFPYEPPPRFAKQYQDPYVGEIAYVDEQIGRLCDALDRLSLDRRTLVVLTGDHGEGRGEHDEDAHGTFVFDTTLSVPLVFRCPGKIPAGTRVAAQVRLVDIPNTVLSFLGMEVFADVQGTDLLPLMIGSIPDPKLSAYGESMQPRHSFGYAPLRALRRDGWKYIHAPQARLYHVRDDPHELKNLAASEPQRTLRMRDELRRLIADAPTIISGEDAQRELSAEDLRKLAALGYVDGGGDANELAGADELELFDVLGPDPHDNADAIALSTLALMQLKLGNDAEAERLLRELLNILGESAETPPEWNSDDAVQSRGGNWPFKYMGFVLSRRGDHAQAIEYYRKALAYRPNDGTTLTRYAMSLSELGRFDDAIVVFQKALQIRPTFAHTHESFAVALSRVGRSDEAVAQFRIALDMEPENTPMCFKLARLLIEIGRISDAVDQLKRGLEVSPNAIQLRGMLAQLLVQQRRDDEAADQIALILQRHPREFELMMNLAQSCMQADDSKTAEQLLGHVLEIDPGRATAWHAMGFLKLRIGQSHAAVQAFRAGLESSERDVSLINDLAWLLATSSDPTLRDGAEALALVQSVHDATGSGDPNVLDTLAAALAELGRFDEAVETIELAIRTAGELGSADLKKRLADRGALYRDHKPYRMSP